MSGLFIESNKWMYTRNSREIFGSFWRLLLLLLRHIIINGLLTHVGVRILTRVTWVLLLLGGVMVQGRVVLGLVLGRNETGGLESGHGCPSH